MADDFVQQIARLLGQSPEDTERTLQTLADSIREEVESTGAAKVEGLGVFRQDGDTLAFEPAPSLADAVNHRYAGLLPLDSGPALVPGKETPEEAPPEELTDTEDPFAGPTNTPLHLPAEEDAEPVRDLASPPEPEHEAPVVEAEESEPVEDFEAAESPLSGLETPASPGFDAAEPEGDLSDEGMGDEGFDDLDFGEEELEGEAFDSEDLDEDLDDSDIDALLEGVWMPATGATDASHPLGPTPPEIMEEADFSVMNEDAAEDDGEPVPQAEAGSGADVPPPARAPESDAPEQAEPLKAGPSATSEPVAPPARDVPAPGFAATAASAAKPAQPGRATQSRERRNLAPLLGVLGAVALAALALFWFLNREPAVPPTAERSAPVAADTSTAIAPPVAPDTSAVAEALPAEPELEPEPPSADPLRSSAGIEPAQGGFAWVVASELSREPAERRAAAFREQGFRAGVVAEEAGGRTRYRVALGQFSSLDEANRYRSNLPAGVPADTWLLRF